MTPTISLNTAALNQQLGAFVGDTGRSLVKVVKDQARLFVGDLMGGTPPFGKHAFTRKSIDGGPAESWNEQRRIGEKAVKRDLKRVFRSAAVLARFLARKFKRPELEQQILKYSAMSDTWAINTILRSMGFRARAEVIATRKDHLARRNRKGRVSRHGERIFILDEKSLTAYTKQEVGHVGKAKAGWLRAATGLGLKGIPEWIRRHRLAAASGLFQPDYNPAAPSVTLGNLVDYAQEFDPMLFNAAIASRIEKMKREAAAIVAHNYRKHGGRA